MKNFPHQINKIPRILKCLKDYYDLEIAGKDINDDGIYGYAMARNRNYTFRGMEDSSTVEIEAKITLEIQSPLGNQGARTCARDLRRMFVLMGFIDPYNHKITDLGMTMLKVGDNLNSPSVLRMWRNVLLDTAIDGLDEAISHPYRILLKLLKENPGLASEKLALALEARDDTDAEYNRILELSRRDDWENIINEIGATRTKARNAVKILPALGKQIGDLRVNGNLYYLTNQGLSEIIQILGSEAIYSSIGISDGNIAEDNDVILYKSRRSLKRTSSESIANTQTDIDLDLERYSTLVDLSDSILARQERTIRHNEIVKKVAEHFEKLEYHIYENQIDCLAVKTNIALIIEVKTLNGELKDERNQVMKAFAQVYYYEYFNLDEFSRYPTIKVACFSKKPNDVHLKFLEMNQCFVMWLNEDVICYSDALRNQIMQ